MTEHKIFEDGKLCVYRVDAENDTFDERNDCSIVRVDLGGVPIAIQAFPKDWLADSAIKLLTATLEGMKEAGSSQAS